MSIGVAVVAGPTVVSSARSVRNSKAGPGTGLGFAVDLPSADGRRKPYCRSGFATRKAALAALERALEAERTGLNCEEGLTVADYLVQWLRTKEEVLKPTTYARYRDHVHTKLVPAFGRLALTDLRARHLTAWREAELARGRGRTTVYRIGVTLQHAGLCSAHAAGC